MIPAVNHTVTHQILGQATRHITLDVRVVTERRLEGEIIITEMVISKSVNLLSALWSLLGDYFSFNWMFYIV